MDKKRLLSLTRQAVTDYLMINEGDKIAVGVSGGKDSLVLLHALIGLKKILHNNFNIVAITVNTGVQNFNTDAISDFCKDLNIDFYCIDTEISQIVFDIRKESNPCSLCSKMRKGALNNMAIELGCNKIAYAHHMDDVISTAFLSLFFEGKWNTFSPVTKLDKTGLQLIRPLIYVTEFEVKGFIRKNNILPVKNPCLVDKKTKREYINDIIIHINHGIPGVRKKIFHAIVTSMPAWILENYN